MENTPEAAGAAPAPQTEAPINTNAEPAAAPASAPDMHGFTSEQLADIDKFFKANGGFDAIKSKISNPQPVAQPQAEEPKAEAKTQAQPAEQPIVQTKPQGYTNDEIMAQYFFEKLSQKPEYASISKEIANGDVLTEMSKLGIQFKYPDGSWNNERINDYLELRAKTVPAKATSTEPNASSAPTVEYVEVGENISNIDQAYQVLSQDAKLRAQGLAGHPKIALAEAFIKEQLSKKK